MKRILLTLIFISLLIGWITPSYCRDGIHFVENAESWQAVIELGKAENKPIFVDVYTEWCGPCKWMDQNVFNQAEVGEFMNREFINVKLDAEKGWGPAFKDNYGVAAYPTYLFFDPEGDMVYSAGGSSPAERFLSLSQRAIDNWRTGLSSKSLQDLLNSEAGKNPENIRSMLSKLGGNDPRTSYLLDIYLDILDEDSLYTKNTLQLIRLNLSSPISASSKAFEVLIKDYQSAPIHSTMLMSSWSSLIRLMESTIDSAALQNNHDLYLSMLRKVDAMYLDQSFAKLFSLYYQARYHAISKNQDSFIAHMEAYFDYVFLQHDYQKWIERDYEDFGNRLRLEYGVVDIGQLTSDRKERALKSHYSAVRVIGFQVQWLIILFKESFPEAFRLYDSSRLDMALKRSNELYENNRVFVNPILIKSNLDFLEKYKLEVEE